MSNEQTVNQKNAEVKETSKDQKNLTALLEKVKTPEKSNSTKESIYKDTDYLKTFDGGKLFRTKKRKQLNRFAISFIQNVKANNKEEIKKSFSEFVSFYKETYKRNDYSISSIYGGKENSNEFIFLQNFLQIVSECKKLNLV